MTGDHPARALVHFFKQVPGCVFASSFAAQGIDGRISFATFPDLDSEVVGDINGHLDGCGRSDRAACMVFPRVRANTNETMPEAALRGLDRVRAFGEEHDLGMLVDGEWPAGHAEALEALIVAGRVLDAKGVFTDNTGDVTIYFLLRGFSAREGRRR